MAYLDDSDISGGAVTGGAVPGRDAGPAAGAARPPRPAGPGRRRVLTVGGLAVGGVLLGAGPAVARAGRTAGAGPWPGGLTESVVWEAGEDGTAEHFVYGVAVTAAGTVLASSEARLSAADTGAHHITVKRSTDGGATWSPSQIVEPSTGGQCWANPTLVADPATGLVSLFYALNDANESSRLLHRVSRDDGRSWSPPADLTALFAGDPAGRPFHLPGPGHGIALSDGTLAVQVWHRHSVALPVDQRAYGAGVLLSDDHGQTWRAGGYVPLETSYPVNEARLFERADGALVLNGRYSSGGVHPRIESVSTDRGRSWSPPTFDPAVRLYTAVDSGLVRLSGGPHRPGPSRLLFSRPDSTTARENLTVSVSYDEGRSFPYERVVYAGSATYSDLARLPDGSALVLYGKDTSTGHPVDHVSCARFDLGWLTGGHDTPSGGPDWYQQRFDAAGAHVVATHGLRTATTADPYTASGRGLLLRGVTPGASIDLRLPVRRAGRYDLVLRCRAVPDGPVATAALDGAAPGPAAPLALPDAAGYAEVHCGTVDVARPGAHTVRLTLTPADLTPVADVELDYLALRA